MEIEWVGSPNYNEGRKGYKPFAIFVHIECGTEEGTKSWFENPASQVSAHYGISRDGKIDQFVKEEDEAWAVGLVNNSSWKYYQSNVNPNYTTISIENEGYPKDGFTEAQIQANIELITDIVKRWNIRVDLDTAEDHQHLCGHYQLDSVNRKDCPSDKYPWDRVIKAVQANLAGNNEEEDEMLKEQFAALESQVKELQDALKGSLNPTVPSWGLDSMNKAVQYEILKGDEHGNLLPNAYTTRTQQMELFKRIGVMSWYDQIVSDWAKEAFDKAVQLGLIQGDGEGKLDPKKPITKEQFITFMDATGFLDWVAEKQNKNEVKA